MRVPTLPVLACFLGGATEKWSEGIVVALLGLILLVDPPGFSLGRNLNLILLATVACAATAFLPATWFSQPAWRLVLQNDFNIVLGSTLSPQPWISLGCFVSFLAGLSWLYYVSALDLELREVRQQLRRFATGIVLLAALCDLLYSAHTALPFWHNQRGFGPFPNRNQTANLFGLTAVVILACGQDDIRHSRETLDRLAAWLRHHRRRDCSSIFRGPVFSFWSPESLSGLSRSFCARFRYRELRSVFLRCSFC